MTKQATVSLVPFVEGTAARGSQGTGCHPELNGGQAQHWNKTAGLGTHSEALHVHDAASLHRRSHSAFRRGLRLCDHGYGLMKSADLGQES